MLKSVILFLVLSRRLFITVISFIFSSSFTVEPHPALLSSFSTTNICKRNNLVFFRAHTCVLNKITLFLVLFPCCLLTHTHCCSFPRRVHYLIIFECWFDYPLILFTYKTCHNTDIFWYFCELKSFIRSKTDI